MAKQIEIKKIAEFTGHQGAIYALHPLSPTRFLSGGGDGRVVEWNLEEPDRGVAVAIIDTHIFSLYQSKKQPLLAIGNMDGGIHWVDRERKTDVKNIQHHKKGVYGLFEYGDTCLSLGGEGKLTKWSLERLQPSETLHLSAINLRYIVYHQHRQELMIASSDQSIYILDSTDLTVVDRIYPAHDSSVFCLAYSPDERFVVSGGRDAQLKIWNANPFSLVRQIPAHWYAINHLAYNATGSLLATASRDKTIKIWDASQYELLKVIDRDRFTGHTGSVNRLWWSPYRDFLVSAGDDRRIIVWQILE